MQSLQTITDFIRWGASRFNEAGLFFGHGTDNALDEAAALVLHSLHLPPDLPGVWLNARLTEEERSSVLAQLQRRIDERIPVPYLTGEAWFAGLRFKVTPDVLIPRSPLAELVEKGFEPWIETAKIEAVLDLCCGSGCIGIACAYAFPEAEVTLTDISPAALAVAQRNIAEHGLQARVQAIQSDLFTALPSRSYDLIISNPPYVSKNAVAHLPEEYHHEPILGLEAGEQGLDVIVEMLRQAANYLNAGGILVVEAGNAQDVLSTAFPEIPFTWLDCERGGEGILLLTAEQLCESWHRFS